MFPPPVFSWRGQGQFQSNANVISRKSLSYTLQNKYTEIKLHIKSNQDILINFY